MLQKHRPFCLDDHDFDFLKHHQDQFLENKIYKDFVSLLRQSMSSVEKEEFTRLKKAAIKSSENLREQLVKDSYGTQEVVSLLNITRQAILSRIQQHKMIAFKVNKNYFFPKWQFDLKTSSGIYSSVREILKAFPKTLTEIEIVNWFSRNAEGNERKRYELLDDPKNLSLLMQEARSLGGQCG